MSKFQQLYFQGMTELAFALFEDIKRDKKLNILVWAVKNDHRDVIELILKYFRFEKDIQKLDNFYIYDLAAFAEEDTLKYLIELGFNLSINNSCLLRGSLKAAELDDLSSKYIRCGINIPSDIQESDDYKLFLERNKNDKKVN